MLTAHIRSLEEQLLDCNVRASAERLDLLIADHFIEFGASGRVYTKPEIIATLQADPSLGPGVPIVKDFESRELAPNVVLATYRCGQSLRSSIWKHDEAGWRMVFHQGTRTSSESGSETAHRATPERQLRGDSSQAQLDAAA